MLWIDRFWIKDCVINNYNLFCLAWVGTGKININLNFYKYSKFCFCLFNINTTILLQYNATIWNTIAHQSSEFILQDFAQRISLMASQYKLKVCNGSVNHECPQFLLEGVKVRTCPPPNIEPHYKQEM